MDELNVKLGLDTTEYENSLEGALDTFAGFQKALNKNKIGFDSNQLEEMNKVFSDIRSTAIKEINAIQKKMDAVSTKQIKLGIDRDILKKQLDAATKTLNNTPTYMENSYKEALKEYNKAKSAFNNIEIKLDIEDVELDSLRTKLETLIKDFKSNPLEFDFDSDALKRFNTEVDNVMNGTKRTGEEFDKLEKKVNNVARTSTRLNLMGRIMSQIKNTIAAAINPLNMFRKGWNEIIMSDTSSFGATFRQIGENILNFVTPAFEKVAMWILKLLSYVNIFLKAVTGGKLDLFAKTAKSGKAAEKSAAKINRMTAGFDEINDIGSDSSGGSSGSSGALPIDMPEVDTKWADAIKNAGEWIHKNWKIIAIGIGAIAAAILLISLASKKSASPLAKVGSGFSNLLSSLGKATEIIAILGGLALVIESLTGFINAFAESGMKWYEAIGLIGGTVGIITAAFAAISFAISKFSPSAMGLASAIVIFAGISAVLLTLTGVIKAITSATKAGANVGETMIAVMGSIIALVTALTIAAQLLQSPLAMAGLAVLAASISAILLVVAATLPTILDACGKFINAIAPPVIEIIKVINAGIETMIYALGTVLPPIITAIGRNFKIVFDGIKDVVEAVGRVMNTIFNGIAKVILSIGTSICNVLNTAKNLVKTVLREILNFINKLGPAVNNFIDNMIKGVTKLINFMISGIEYLVNTLVINGINKIIKAINSVAEYVGITIPTVPKMSIPRFVPKLDVGTGYVPNDMLAVIHQGEAVIPKEFNDRTYFGGGNEETNSLLTELIDRVERIEFSPYIRVKDVGEASIAYINSKSRSTGRSVI